jgi:hypothetical protein
VVSVVVLVGMVVSVMVVVLGGVVVLVVVSIMVVAGRLTTPSPVQQRHNLKICQNLHVPVK